MTSHGVRSGRAKASWRSRRGGGSSPARTGPAGNRGPGPRGAREGTARRRQRQRGPQPAQHQHGQRARRRLAHGLPHQLPGPGGYGRPAGSQGRAAPALGTLTQQHTSKLILKSLLDHTSIRPGAIAGHVVLPLIRTDASIIAGSAPNAAMTFTGIPSDPRSTMTNEEWRINAQLRLGLPLASYHNQPHAPCPNGCKHPQTKEPVKCGTATTS